jgi:lysophospholipase L1-like esterase
VARRRAKKGGGWIANVVLLITSIVLFLGMAEAACWLIAPPAKPGLPQGMFEVGPGGVWRMTPEFHGIMDNRVDYRNARVTADSQGLRIVPAAPAEAARHVLVLGDSQAFGHGLNDEDAWPNRLQEELNRRKLDVKVSNLAVPAVNIDQYLDHMRLIGPNLGENDTVLVALSWNDVITPPSDTQSNHIVEGYLVNGPAGGDDSAARARVRIYDFTGVLVPQFQSVKTFLDTLSQSSALVNTLYPRAKAIYYRLRSHSPVADLVKAGVPEANFLMIRQMNDIAREHGARFVVVLLPERQFFDDQAFDTYSVHGRDYPTNDYQYALVRPSCEALKIECLNPFALLREHQKEGLVFPVDGHYNAKGTALIGPWVADRLFPEATDEKAP